MITLEIENFDIEQIANSGQCFRMYELGNGIWEVFALDEKLKIQKNKKIHIFDCCQQKFDDFWCDYFDLRTDYKTLQKRIFNTNDDYLCKAVKFGEGLRILKQDVWEMIVSFVISQQNNIPRIKNCLKTLCVLNGDKFPRPEDLLALQGEKLKSVKLGYREDYLLKIAEAIIEKNFSLDELKKMPYELAIQYLQTLRGVGGKVANCVALFGLYKIEAFPIDVWIKKIIQNRYEGHFSLEKLGLQDIGGLVQQYMYFYERSYRSAANLGSSNSGMFTPK